MNHDCYSVVRIENLIKQPVKNFLLAAAIFYTVQCHAQSNIAFGEAAPTVHVSHWLKNEPIDKNLGDKFIVLEFWAIWYGFFNAAVPYLNNIQMHCRYKKNLRPHQGAEIFTKVSFFSS
jgi:hypothetical protein